MPQLSALHCVTNDRWVGLGRLLQGMSKAYRTLSTLLVSRFGGSSAAALAGPPQLPLARAQLAGSDGTKTEALSTLVNNPQYLVMVLVLLILLWRFYSLAATAAMLQRIATRR